MSRLDLDGVTSASALAAWQRLRTQQWAVIDGAVGQAAAARMRQEIVALREAGGLHLNSTHLVRDGRTQLLPKRGIWEAEMAEPATQAAAPLCTELLVDPTLRTMAGVGVPELRLTGQAIKLQYNEGDGACFPIHVDSEESVDGRRLTAILYLNPDWRPEHGGHLRLYPPFAPPVDVEPRHDRLVLFLSNKMLHRVLPSRAPRCCLTVWMSERGQSHRTPGARSRGAEALRAAAAQGTDMTGAEVDAALQDPTILRFLGKLQHADEWARSVEESHADTDARREALARFWDEVRLAQRALRPLISALESQLGEQLAPAAA